MWRHVGARCLQAFGWAIPFSSRIVSTRLFREIHCRSRSMIGASLTASPNSALQVATGVAAPTVSFCLLKPLAFLAAVEPFTNTKPVTCCSISEMCHFSGHKQNIIPSASFLVKSSGESCCDGMKKAVAKQSDSSVFSNWDKTLYLCIQPSIWGKNHSLEYTELHSFCFFVR